MRLATPRIYPWETPYGDRSVEPEVVPVRPDNPRPLKPYEQQLGAERRAFLLRLQAPPARLRRYDPAAWLKYWQQQMLFRHLPDAPRHVGTQAARRHRLLTGDLTEAERKRRDAALCNPDLACVLQANLYVELVASGWKPPWVRLSTEERRRRGAALLVAAALASDPAGKQEDIRSAA